MHVHTILAAATGASGTDNLPLLVGLLGLAISLVAIFRVSALRQELDKSAAPSASRPSAAPAQAAGSPMPAQPAAADAVPPEIVAVIAAAVASFTGRAHRVVSIKRQSTTWEKAGRQSVLTSHRIR